MPPGQRSLLTHTASPLRNFVTPQLKTLEVLTPILPLSNDILRAYLEFGYSPIVIAKLASYSFGSDDQFVTHQWSIASFGFCSFDKSNVHFTEIDIDQSGGSLDARKIVITCSDRYSPIETADVLKFWSQGWREPPTIRTVTRFNFCKITGFSFEDDVEACADDVVFYDQVHGLVVFTLTCISFELNDIHYRFTSPDARLANIWESLKLGVAEASA